MEAYTEAVVKVLTIYIHKGITMPTHETKLTCIEGMFTYLSTAEVKGLLNRPDFARFRNMLLTKLDEYTKDAYVRQHRARYHKLNALMRELFTHLVEDDSVSPRRSERQKKAAVRTFNARFEGCSKAECVSMAAELKQWSAVKPPMEAAEKPVTEANVEVMPRRSARLLNRAE